MDDGSNPYEVLGVSPEATAQEIRKAWHGLSRKYHPDKAKTEQRICYNTVMMFKVNEAYELLSDETKRRDYDEGKQDRDDEDSVDDDHQYYEEAPSPEPDHLGCPYQGPDRTTSFYFDCNGTDGADARHGLSGHSGSYPGGDGTDGGDAGDAMPGSCAQDLSIFMKTTISPSGYFQVEVYATKGSGEVMDPTRPGTTQVPLKMFVGADFTAEGGNGGNGGNGGDGGDGAKGYRGRDATRHSSGSNGGPGGDGGDGGRGSSGADGGHGGDVEVVIHSSDIYLLMRVNTCDPLTGPGNRIAGGKGGRAGRHGQGGRGGRGGAGGSSYSWEEPRYSYGYGSNGRAQRGVTYEHHSNPGGWRGTSGNNGSTYTYPLLFGNDGSDGTFRIIVEPNHGARLSYSCRYDLTFQDSITNHLSAIPGKNTFEFGETVIVSACLVKNTGYMPMPQQRTMIGFEDIQGITPTWTDRLFLEQNSDLRPGGEKEASQGHLRYLCPFPSSLGTDYDPIRKHGAIRYVANQLGPENDTTDISLVSDFQEKYGHFHDSAENLVMAYPIENRAGVLGIHSLGNRETTILRLKINNISNEGLGSNSKGGRSLLVHLYYADDKDYEIPLRSFIVRGDKGKILNISPTYGGNRQRRGHFKEILVLPRQSDTTIQLTLKLDDDDMRPCATAGLQADIYLQKIPTLCIDGQVHEHIKKRLVQRRLFLASHQPKFAEDKESDVVLVTTTASTADQVGAWESLIEERLWLRPKVYSLSRYGHIDATKTGEQKTLRETFSGSLVVLLNEQYFSQPNVESERKTTRRPSQLMKSVFDFDESTRFLVVGGQPDAVEHMTPKASGVNAVEATKLGGTTIRQKQNRKTFQDNLTDCLETERTKGFAKERVAPMCDIVQVKTRTLFRTPKKSRYEKIVSARSEKLQAWLARRDKLRHYRIEWEPSHTPTLVEGQGGLRHKCWHIGEFRIFVGPPRFQNSIVLLGEEPITSRAILSTPEAIHSLPTIHSTMSAAPFEVKIKCFRRSLLARSESESRNHEDICTATRYSLVNDFLLDVSNYYQGKMHVKSVIDRSQTIRSLLSSEAFRKLISESLSSDAVELKRLATTEISLLLAGLQSAAESKDLAPWWSPLSRKHKARRDMQEVVRLFQRRVSSLIDEEEITIEREEISREAKTYIKETRGKFWLRARGRWREALSIVHSPSSPRQQYQNSVSMLVRSRREAELDAGTSHKVRKLCAESFSPNDAMATRQHLRERLETCHDIRKTTERERGLFIQT